MKIRKSEVQAFQRNDFVAFAERSFYELNPTIEYRHNWHIDAVAEVLERSRAGSLPRLIINIPPRSLKSHLVSIAFPAWLLGHDPSAQIVCASYAQDLSDKLASDCRVVMSSPWYCELFPGTRLAGSRQAVHDFWTTQRGSRLATSVGGVLLGRGADYIIIDDALRPDEALSETQRERANSWFNDTVISRLNDKRNGRIILIMQRLHEDDLAGHLIRQGGWHVLKFPAVAEEDETHIINTPYGVTVLTRRQGEALHPEREGLEELAKIREIQGEYTFSGQYQQSPAPLGGGLVQTGWFKTYTEADLPANFELVVQSWDTANKPSELSDYSVCSTWGIKNNRLYLLHIYRKRVGYPDLKRAVRDQAQAFGAEVILIEDKASGTQLIQDLISEGMHWVQTYEPAMDKVMRLHSVTSTIENGFVYLPGKAEWLPEYLHELATFPNGRFDDQVDSTSQALDWFKNHCRDQVLGVVIYEKRQAGVDHAPHPSDSGSKRPKCGQCGEPMTQPIPTGLRCMQCGTQWLGPASQPDVPRFNRRNIFNDRVRSMPWFRG